MSTAFPAIPFDPDIVSIDEFSFHLQDVNPQVASQLLVTPRFGFLAAVICEVVDTDLLCEVQELLIEPVDGGQSFASGLWTIPEVIGYMNQRQDDFLKRTRLLMRREFLLSTPETHRFDLPQDLILLRRVVFRGADPDEHFSVPVTRSDTFDLDHGQPSWEFDNTLEFPVAYSDTEAHQLGIIVGPGFKKKGRLEALYVPRGPRLGNTGVCLAVPDMFAGGIRWGMLADMLKKHGRAQDPQRGEYCEERYELAVESANLMLSGWA